MKKILSIILLIFLNMPNGLAYEEIYWPLNDIEKQVLTFWDTTCTNIKQTDIPTIFIPWILASWYSEEWFEDSKIKRWIPDPITHSYDTLFFTFKENKYDLKDVFYADEFNTYIDWNPKQSLYLFWYDWKKDNKVTAKLLWNLIFQIREKYEEENNCDIWTVNIIAHSMWWLVARAMLEDMCATDLALKDYYNRDGLQTWELKNFTSSKCNYTKINKLITIWTPQRGSPGSFPMWTKWTIGQANPWIDSKVLKWQLGISYDEELYKLIHGYNDKLPNGIVTIWQLLPDLWNSWIYNEELKYLYKDDKNLDRKNHPKNEFLEELNKSENIEKLFSNISWEYTLYYSNLTWNTKNILWINNYKNNIVWFNLLEKIYLPTSQDYEIPDISSSIKWIGIYSLYEQTPIGNIYNIKNNITNEKWLWWDWTVPSFNSKLVANDIHNPKEEENKKFKSIEVECFENNFDLDLDSRENPISKKLGGTLWELCSHTKLAITTSFDVFNKIIWVDITVWEENLSELYWNIWYLDYNISFNTEINSIFDENYERHFKNNEDLNIFLKTRYNKWFPRSTIELWSPIIWIIRYEILSPINIIVEDEFGRKIWIDQETGMIVNEIPWAWTSWDTEWSNEPEFFIIPKTGTWELNHKIISTPTGDWEYHIVIQDFENNDEWILEEKTKLIIPWFAKKWIIENYEIDVKNWEWNYIKIIEIIDNKYNEILKKIYYILDNKYSIKQKQKLKNNLNKIITRWNNKNKYTEKVFYLIQKIFNYL